MTAPSGVRVRFCPSPTGFLHVGGVRTALYNWLFARSHGGVAILRIEDTDRTRETAGATDQIQRSLDWLGLDWDESPRTGGPHAPYVQSERLGRYREVAERLLAEGRAYHDYRAPEEVEAARAVARETDDPAAATRAHRELTAAQVADYEASGRLPSLRLRVPEEGETAIADLVRGEVRWQNRLLGDTVLVRPDGAPTYQLANPVDDLDMGVTHVIRGDDLLPSTPRQIALSSALGERYPVTGHLSMILGPDRKRLSKRHGAASVEELRAQGYVAPAVVNYLALLGWSLDDRTEIFSLDELVAAFTIERVNPAPAIFDHTKLLWMNGVHLRALPDAAYADALRGFLEEAGSPLAHDDRLAETVPLVREKIGSLGEFPAFAGSLLEPLIYDEPSWQKLVATPRAAEILDAAIGAVEDLPELTAPAVDQALRGVGEALGMKPRQAFLPIRVAIAGRTVSPGLFESIAFLGREEALGRLRAARARL